MSADVWQVIESVSTSGAFLIAAVVYKGQARDRRRDQASRVSAEFDGASGMPDIDNPGSSLPGVLAVGVTVHNGSDQPIFDVFPMVNGPFQPIFDTGSRVTLPGHATATLAVERVEDTPMRPYVHVGVQFMDSSGHHWTRWPNGTLASRDRLVRLIRFAAVQEPRRWRRLRRLAWNVIYRLQARRVRAGRLPT